MKKHAMPRVLRALISNPRLRGGVPGALATLLAVVVVVAVNIAVSMLEDDNAWTIDCTYNQVTVQSEATKAVIDGLSKDVDIYLFASSGEENIALRTLLARYEARSARVRVIERDLAQSPVLAASLTDSLDGASVENGSVVVHCPETARARVLSADDFVTSAYDEQSASFVPTGIIYEKSISQALSYVTSDTLARVQMLQGHGELDASEASFLLATLKDADYQVSAVNLSQGDALDADALLMILSPVRDLSAADLEAILDFCAQGGSLLVTGDYADPVSLSNLNTLLRCYGVSPLPGVLVADTAQAGTYYDNYPSYIVPEMPQNEFTGGLISAGMDLLILPGARAYAVSPVQDKDVAVYPLLQSGSQSYIRDHTDGLLTLEKQPGDLVGAQTAALLSSWTQQNGLRSRALVIGSSGALTTEWIAGLTYSETFLLTMTRALVGTSEISLPIDARPIRTSMVVSEPTLLLLVIGLLPLLALCAALVVLAPRRNR